MGKLTKYETETEDSYINLGGSYSDDRLAVIYFLWIGGVSVCSTAAVINSLEYFDHQFENHDVKFIFPLPSMIVSIIVTFIITPLSNMLSYSTRVVLTMTLVIISLCVIPFVADIFKGTMFGFFACLGILIFMGFLNNICYASLAGFTSQIDKKYTAYFLIGIAIVGLGMSFLKIGFIYVFKQLSPNHVLDKGAVLPNALYFFTTAFMIFVGLILHAKFLRSEFYFTRVRQRVCSVFEDEGEFALNRAEQNPATGKRDFKTLFEVYHRTRGYFWLMIVAVTQQNMFYPGLALQKKIVGMEDEDKTVSIVTTFALFFIIGKKIGQYREYYDKGTIIFCTLIRFIIIALIFVQARFDNIPIVETAWFCYLNISLLALSLGVINVGIFILSAELVPDDKKELSGFVSVMAVNFGSLFGGLASLALTGHAGGH